MNSLKVIGILIMIVSILMLANCFNKARKINENSSALELLMFQEELLKVALPSGILFAVGLGITLTSFMLEQLEKKGGD